MRGRDFSYVPERSQASTPLHEPTDLRMLTLRRSRKRWLRSRCTLTILRVANTISFAEPTLSRGQSLCASRHSTCGTNGREAAVALYPKAIHHAFGAVAHVQEMTVVAQRHVDGGSAWSFSGGGIEQAQKAVPGNEKARDSSASCVGRECVAAVPCNHDPAISLLRVGKRGR